MSDLRSKVIRLAHARPELRPALLPLLKSATVDANASFAIKAVSHAFVLVTRWARGGGFDKAEIQKAMLAAEKAVYSFRNALDPLPQAASIAHSALDSILRGRSETGIHADLRDLRAGLISLGVKINPLEAKALKGLKSVKEVDPMVARKITAQEIASALTDSLRGLMEPGERSERPRISSDALNVEISYQNYSLPRGGAAEVGRTVYHNAVDEVVKKVRRRVVEDLSKFKDKISHLDVSVGEKSWVYVSVLITP